MNSTYRIEKDFILELCKIYTFDKEKIVDLMNQPLDYPYILGNILFHRIGGAAYTVLKTCDLLGKVNREFRNILKTIFDSNCDKNNSYKLALEWLYDMFKGNHFPYALLKGSYLMFVYESGIRTSNDFDILVNQEDISKISSILKENGYQQGHVRNGYFKPASRREIIMSRMNRGETVPFVKEVGLSGMQFCEIDLNFSLDFKPAQEGDIVKKLLSNIKPLIKISKGTLNTLNKADFLIQLCTHLYKEATVINWVQMSRDVSLYKYIDIYLFARKMFDDNFKQDLLQRITEYGLERECFYTFYYTKLLFDIENEMFDSIISAIEPKNTDFLKEIYAPSDGKLYTFDIDYKDWVFEPNRGGKLHEVTNAKT